MTALADQRFDLIRMYRDEARLSELHRWLTIGGSSWVVGGGAMFVPAGIIFGLMKWAAVLFGPYMLWRLFQLRRFGWMLAFVALVAVPLVASLLSSELTPASYVLSMLPLLTFYLYTWALRHAVGLWREELRWRREDVRAAVMRSVGMAGAVPG